MLKTLIIITYVLALVCCIKYGRKDGKLLLNPVELVDLIVEEKLKTGVPAKHLRPHKLTDAPHLLDLEDETTTEEECRDEESLQSRKVWSRWSKWGDCSVTCGAGAISRQRACVAGRCAHGEREEQRRPCVRAPCADVRPIDDLHDAD